MATRDAEEQSLIQSLLARACSLPVVFEDRVATQRLCGIVYNTAAPCPTFFTNLAISLEATTPRPEFAVASPVLAARRGAPPAFISRSASASTQVHEEALGVLAGVTEALDMEYISGDERGLLSRQVALEMAAAAQDPHRAAEHVPSPKPDAANTGYTQRTINMIAGACANVLQTHGAAAQPLKVS